MLFSLNECVGWTLCIYAFIFFFVSWRNLEYKVSFQHLGSGMWARRFKQDVIVPPGNGTFLITISRQALVYIWSIAVLVKRVSGYTQRKEGKEREPLSGVDAALVLVSTLLARLPYLLTASSTEIPCEERSGWLWQVRVSAAYTFPSNILNSGAW